MLEFPVTAFAIVRPERDTVDALVALNARPVPSQSMMVVDGPAEPRMEMLLPEKESPVSEHSPLYVPGAIDIAADDV